jgi:hypothetical protein
VVAYATDWMTQQILTPRGAPERDTSLPEPLRAVVRPRARAGGTTGSRTSRSWAVVTGSECPSSAEPALLQVT